jgi:hypothetical protein
VAENYCLSAMNLDGTLVFLQHIVCDYKHKSATCWHNNSRSRKQENEEVTGNSLHKALKYMLLKG